MRGMSSFLWNNSRPEHGGHALRSQGEFEISRIYLNKWGVRCIIPFEEVGVRTCRGRPSGIRGLPGIHSCTQGNSSVLKA